jgi:hypothetical protein
MRHRFWRKSVVESTKSDSRPCSSGTPPRRCGAPVTIRDRATDIDIAGVPLRVAALGDIIKSKRAAGRPRDLAVLEVLETALEEAKIARPARPPRRARPRKPS